MYSFHVRNQGAGIINQLKSFESVLHASRLVAAQSRHAIEKHETIKDLISTGLEKCRAVRLSQITVSDVESSPHTCIRNEGHPKLGLPCERPDFFVSHSWHDNWEEKWKANIEDELMYLSVYVMASTKVLIIAGPTYLKRLWCAWELVTVSLSRPSMDNVVVWCVGGYSHNALQKDLRTFAVEDTNCFLQKDKEHILEVIDGLPDARNEVARRILGFSDSMLRAGPGEPCNRITSSQPEAMRIVSAATKLPQTAAAMKIRLAVAHSMCCVKGGILRLFVCFINTRTEQEFEFIDST
jgi:hypothetical protein